MKKSNDNVEQDNSVEQSTALAKDEAKKKGRPWKAFKEKVSKLFETKSAKRLREWKEQLVPNSDSVPPSQPLSDIGEKAQQLREQYLAVRLEEYKTFGWQSTMTDDQ